MSSDSRTSGSSRLSQFGLYRSIDARTEEFLRLSRRRQIRQGCACAAVSTAITVTVVVVILLIYEYAIAVESSIVQTHRRNLFGNSTNVSNDSPIADKLDSSYFGFDQDYYERMPLLVNAMQETSYLDPSGETAPAKNKARYLIANISRPPVTTTKYYRTTPIRRTSPRPFIYEYRSAPPSPFSKTYGSRSWVESYRNAQRLKNLQQVIKYLKSTINAKVGDMHTQPSSTHLTFSGVYIEPSPKETIVSKPTTPTLDVLISSSEKSDIFRANHQSDPLFSFKPESPGDVNLLADGFFRFSPVPTPALIREKKYSIAPMFKHRTKYCTGEKCNETNENKTKTKDKSPGKKPTLFSILLNLFPSKPNTVEHFESKETDISNIYLTTTRPIIQFKRRSTNTNGRTTTRVKLPRVLEEKRPSTYYKDAKKEHKMIVHVNVYPQIDSTKTNEDVFEYSSTMPSSTTITTTRRYATEMPILTSTQVEDYHVGSSGVIPVESRLTPAPPPAPPIFTLPSVTTMIPFFGTDVSSTETVNRITHPTEILKFSEQDAKVPDHYIELMKIRNDKELRSQYDDIDDAFEMNRRNSKESVTTMSSATVELQTLVTKLRNEEEDTETTTALSKDLKEKEDEEYSDEEEVATTTTASTYVPQINGHYRSVSQNARNPNSWFGGQNLERYRKRKLEMSVKGYRKPENVPQYVEIKRNNTRISFNAKVND